MKMVAENGDFRAVFGILSQAGASQSAEPGAARNRDRLYGGGSGGFLPNLFGFGNIYTSIKYTSMRCTPMRYTPMRCTPMKCTPVRCTSIRYTP